MILTFQTKFSTVDDEDRFADIDVPASRCVDDLFKYVCAETGVSLNSPMELIVNGVKYYRNDTRSLEEAGINEYDMVEVNILKNGGHPIPANVTVMDIYGALGDHLKRMHCDISGPAVVETPSKEIAAQSPAVVTAVVAPAPVVAPTPVKTYAVKAPSPINAFAVKPVNAFAVKASAAPAEKPVDASAEKPVDAPAVVVSAPEVTAPKVNAFAVKPTFAVKGAGKFMVKKS